MASIFKRKNQDGTSAWRAVVRIKGYPTVCNHFDRKQEAEDWAKETERRIRFGQFNFEAQKQHHTYADLADRLHLDGALQHHRSLKNIQSQIDHWKERLGAYALVHITPEFIGKERQLLIDTPSFKGTKRTPATINRYMATLSSFFSYAVKRLRWLDENPCTNLLKLKAAPGRDRVLTIEETIALISACRASRSPYLYCIMLIAITTGARRGEILNLDWKHIDFDNRLAFLKSTKNGRPRSIALADAVIAELQRLHALRDPNKPLVFASKTAFGRVDVKKAWMQALRQANIPNFRFHDVRHTFATLAAAQGASNLELATAMGHRTLQMLQRYTHLDAQATRKFSTQITQNILHYDHNNK